MNEMVKTMLNNSEKLVQALKDLSVGGTKPVDIQRLFLSFTMDSFCEIGFGMSIGSLAAEMPPKWKKFVDYWDELQFLCPERAFHPEWVVQKALGGLARKGLPVGFLCKQEMEIYEMDRYVNECIDEVIAERIRNGPMTKHAVIAENAEGASPRSPSPTSPGASSPKTASPRASSRNSSSLDKTKRLDAVELFMSVKPPMTPLELRDVVKGLILGGRDTTGVTIMWAFYEIGCNPEVEAKLMEEVKDLPVDDPVSFYNSLKGCKLVDAVVRETIRLHSPVPIDAKKAVNDDVLPDGTFVGKGWVVTYSPYVMARDTALWGPDADVWRPERWFEGSLAKSEPSPFVYPMFQAGPRICLGKDLALLEAKSCVALMMRAGVVMRHWPDAPPPKYKMGMTLAVDEKGMPMKVTFKE
jgi:cytochrome P450